MLPSADFEDGLKIYNNSVLCKHVGQLPALRPLSLNQPSRKIPKPEHLYGVGPQLSTVKGPLHAGQRKFFPHHRPRFRALPQLAIPRQPGQHRCRITRVILPLFGYRVLLLIKYILSLIHI